MTAGGPRCALGVKGSHKKKKPYMRGGGWKPPSSGSGVDLKKNSTVKWTVSIGRKSIEEFPEGLLLHPGTWKDGVSEICLDEER